MADSISGQAEEWKPSAATMALLDQTRIWFKDPNIINAYYLVVFECRNGAMGKVQFGAAEDDAAMERTGLDFVTLMQSELDAMKERLYQELRAKHKIKRVVFDKMMAHARAQYQAQVREAMAKQEDRKSVV